MSSTYTERWDIENKLTFLLYKRKVSHFPQVFVHPRTMKCWRFRSSLLFSSMRLHYRENLSTVHGANSLIVRLHACSIWNSFVVQHSTKYVIA